MSRRGDSYRGRRQGPLTAEQIKKARGGFILPKTAALSQRQLEADDCLPEDVARWRQTWSQRLEEEGEMAVSYIEPVAKRWPRNCAAEGAHQALKKYNKQKEKEQKCQTKPTE